MNISIILQIYFEKCMQFLYDIIHTHKQTNKHARLNNKVWVNRAKFESSAQLETGFIILLAIFGLL